jgi:hypothetical protein
MDPRLALTHSPLQRLQINSGQLRNHHTQYTKQTYAPQLQTPQQPQRAAQCPTAR